MCTLSAGFLLGRRAGRRSSGPEATLVLSSHPNTTARDPSVFKALRTHFACLDLAAAAAAVPCNTYHLFHRRILGNEERLAPENDVGFAERYVAWKAGRRIRRTLGDVGVGALNGRFVDIVDEVADEVRAGVTPGQEHCVYVLGTELNDRGRVYEHRLEERGLSVCPLADDQKERVRAGIKAVKAGREPEGGDAIQAVVDELSAATAEGVEPHIVLGCTEIPIALEAIGRLPNRHAPTSRADGRTYYDSINILVEGVLDKVGAASF